MAIFLILAIPLHRLKGAKKTDKQTDKPTAFSRHLRPNRDFDSTFHSRFFTSRTYKSCRHGIYEQFECCARRKIKLLDRNFFRSLDKRFFLFFFIVLWMI